MLRIKNKRAAAFAAQWLNGYALGYYLAIAFAGIAGGASLWMLFVAHEYVIFLCTGLLCAAYLEVAYYRYYSWHLTKSKAYSIGAAEVIDVVHREGILRYKRGDQEYALYSNRVVMPKK